MAFTRAGHTVSDVTVPDCPMALRLSGLRFLPLQFLSDTFPL